MKLKIDPYDPKSVDKAIKQVEQYKVRLNQKEKLLLERLSSMGATNVSISFANAIYNGDNDVNVRVELTDNKATILAEGQAVCFIEFGTGVRYGYGYSGQKPSGIVGIGEFGKGKGSNPKGWWYGHNLHSFGNPPNEGMYKTVQGLAEEILKVAREVFSHD